MHQRFPLNRVSSIVYKDTLMLGKKDINKLKFSAEFANVTFDTQVETPFKCAFSILGLIYFIFFHNQPQL